MHAPRFALLGLPRFAPTTLGAHRRPTFGVVHKYVDPTTARCTCGDEPLVLATKPVCPHHAPVAYTRHDAKHNAALV